MSVIFSKIEFYSVLNQSENKKSVSLKIMKNTDMLVLTSDKRCSFLET